MSKPNSEIEHKAAMAAVYLSQGYSREDIASLLKPDEESDPLSSSYISKLIKYALSHEMLKTYSVSVDKLPEDVRQFYEKENSLEYKLLECYCDRRLKHVNIVDFKLTGRDTPDDLAGDAGMVKLASIFVDSLLPPKFVGVSRGYTLNVLASTLNLQKGTGNKLWGNAVIFPSTAEFSEDPSKSLNSAKLARIFSEALTNLDPDDVLSLHNFESLMPYTWDELYSFRAINKTYVRIFGQPKSTPKVPNSKNSKNAYIEKMDTLITSVSDAKFPVGGLLSKSVNSVVKELKKNNPEQAALFDLKGLRPSEWIIGDIAGSLVVKNASSVGNDENEWLREYNHRTNSVNHDQIESLARKADENPSKINGVVAIAITGKSKAPVIRSLLDQGLINRLFCDRETAKALVDICCP